MRYLLDTHTALWYLHCSHKLSPMVRGIIRDKSNELYVSVVSAWEVAIKSAKGTLQFEGGVANFCELLKRYDINILPLTEKQLAYIETLPFIHKDPFDRLLISIAMTEKLKIVTSDENIRKYEVEFVW